MRTVLERILLLAVILGLSMATLSIISVKNNCNNNNCKEDPKHRFKRNVPKDDEVEKRICSSVACFNQSMTILSVMNLSVDPCNDFYKHACGQWKYRDEYSFDRVQNENRFIVQQVLENPAESLVSEAEKNAQRYYHSCIHARETISAAGPSEALLKLLNLIGGVPVDDEVSYMRYFKKKEWDFQETFLTVQHTLNVDCFFHRAIEMVPGKEDKPYPSRNFIKLSHGGLTFPRVIYFLDDSGIKLSSMFSERVKMVKDLLYGSKISYPLIWDMSPIQNELALKDVIEVETQIAQITPLDESVEFLTVLDLSSLAPYIDWNRYLNATFSRDNNTATPHTMMVSSKAFFREVFLIVKSLLASDRGQEKLKNYLFWQTATQFTEKTKNNLKISKSISNCFKKTAEVMPLALGAMFLRNRLGSESSKHLVMQTIGQSIKEAYKENLSSLSWMDNETRILLRDKVDAIRTLIGYPGFILNSKELDKFYDGLNLSSSDFFWNNIHVQLFIDNKKLTVEPDEAIKWTLDLFQGEPTLKYFFNLLVFPSWFMNPPFFDITFPHAINFGSVGAFFGHELVHGFDTMGLKVDSSGRLRQWLNSSAIQPFIEKRSKCLIQQYANYTVWGNLVDGSDTLNEDIADNGGLKASYIAYNSWLNNHEEAHLPLPISLTHQQLFFLSFAQSWCSSSGEGRAYRHSSRRSRVIGTLSNMPEFSSAFQCPLGSRMNPIDKCEIW